MDVNNLSYEELLELAASKAPARDNTRTVDVDGLIVHVDDVAARSWKAFSIISECGEELTPYSLRKMVEFIELVTDVDEAKMLEICGGELASVDDMATLAAKIVTYCYPKVS